VADSFVTGVAGFVGGHLCEFLAGQGEVVAGVDTVPGWRRQSVDYAAVDLCDVEALRRALRHAAPRRVYHLAGMSFPPDADVSPRQALQTNIMGCVSLLDAVRSECPSAVVLLVGSSTVYDAGAGDGAVGESSAVAPASFYGISKYAAELIGMQFVRQLRLDVRLTRSFNHTGPGQSPRFVCSDWARQVARISAHRQEPKLQVGDVGVEVDFTDVRDVARAYHAILAAGAAGRVYNVCSGQRVPLRRVLDHLLAKAEAPVEVVVDESRRRGHTTRRGLVGDHTALTADTGWTPSIPLERTLDDLYAYWREQET
jgi:GDP-4-dehydro-6-deoxy-D-mannose reductase